MIPEFRIIFFCLMIVLISWSCRFLKLLNVSSHNFLIAPVPESFEFINKNAEYKSRWILISPALCHRSDNCFLKKPFRIWQYWLALNFRVFTSLNEPPYRFTLFFNMLINVAGARFPNVLPKRFFRLIFPVFSETSVSFLRFSNE